MSPAGETQRDRGTQFDKEGDLTRHKEEGCANVTGVIVRQDSRAIYHVNDSRSTPAGASPGVIAQPLAIPSSLKKGEEFGPVTDGCCKCRKEASSAATLQREERGVRGLSFGA